MHKFLLISGIILIAASIGGMLEGDILPTLLIIILGIILINVSKKKKDKALNFSDSKIEENKSVSNRENDEQIIQNHKSTRSSDQREFFVVGSKNYNLEEKVLEHIDTYKNAEYGNKNKSEIKAVVKNYGRIFKYEVMQSKKVELIPEPNNPYDKNAISVHFRGEKIGYIPKVETDRVRDLITQKYKPTARISSGPYSIIESGQLKEINGEFKMNIIML